MPYSAEHKHYLEVMGLVPWVRRGADNTSAATVVDEPIEVDAKAASSQASSATSSATGVEAIAEVTTTRTEVACDIGDRLLLESDYQGAMAFVHGSDDAEVLLVFDASMNASMNGSINGECIELDPSDERLLLDMLGAIELDSSSVARCFMAASAGFGPALPLQQHIAVNIKVVLHLVSEVDDIDGDDEAHSRTESAAIAVPVWRLPHPVWIRQQPALKRRAWNVLKAVKHVLGNSKH